MKIVDSLLELKQAFAEQEGEILKITLNDKGFKALQRECLKFCPLTPVTGLCFRCGKNVGNKVLGIEIEKPLKAPGNPVAKYKDEMNSSSLSAEILCRLDE